MLAFAHKILLTLAAIMAVAVLLMAASATLITRAIPVVPAVVIDTVPWIVFAATVMAGLRIWWIVERRRRSRLHHLKDLLILTPSQFESAMAGLFRARGYKSVERTGGAGDLAADIRCKDKSGRSVVVQCKRYSPGRRVGSADIQTFIGMVSVHHKADQGIFVTTSDFTEPARQLAHQHEIVLYDGDDLGRLIGRSAVSNPLL